MKNIKVLVTGDCSNCKKIYSLLEGAVKKRNLDVTLEKVSDLNKIISYGVMQMPAVVIDEKVVFSGGLPSPAQIDSWFGGGIAE